MEAIQEIGARCKEICGSTVFRMYYSCRYFYEGAIGEFHQLGRVWNKEIRPHSEAVKDQAICMLADNTPLDPANLKLRNWYSELYFGIGVLLLGLIGGEYIGAKFVNLYSAAWWEFGLLFALPFYIRAKHVNEFDDIKNRVSLFKKLFIFGAVFGHLFPHRIMNTMPAFLPCLPFVFALLMDPKLDLLSLYGDRKKSVGVASIFTFSLTYFMMHTMGSLGFAGLVFTLLHAALLYCHFSYVCDATKNGEVLDPEKAKLVYLLTLTFVQLVLTMLSFSSTYSATIMDSAEHVHSEH